MKLCKDCKHCIKCELDVSLSQCSLTEKINLVGGCIEFSHCAVQRDCGACGKEGKNFKPKKES